MNKHFLLLWDNPKQAIYTVIGVLMAVGCINVFSASFEVARDMYNGNSYAFLQRYLIGACLGIIVMIAMQVIGYKRILKNSQILWGLCWFVVLLLFIVKFFGVATKGAARWIYLGPFSFQPSELAKLAIILLGANLLGERLNQGKRVFLLCKQSQNLLGMAMFFFIMILTQPDLGTASIVFALAFGMLIIAGIELKAVFAGLSILSVGAVLGVITSPYRLQRVQVWLDPFIDPQGRGFQMVQSLLSIGNGGLLGTNWGHGSGKFFYLPESHTDFAFAIFCQENGLVGATLLILAFTILGIAFVKITLMAKDNRGYLLAAGVTFLIIGQAVSNMAMVCGLLPVIGVPLIFISYGGTSLIFSMAAIGLLLSVYNECEKEQALEELSPEERRSDMRDYNRRRWQP